MAQKDISVMKFGMLTAISYSGKNHHGKSIWECRCTLDHFGRVQHWQVDGSGKMRE